MANFNVLDAYGSVITIQSSTFGGVERQIVGASIIGVMPVTLSGSPSISGTVGASVIGLTPVAVTNIPSISGTVGASIVGQLPGGTAVLGSIAVLQATDPWKVVNPAASITSVTNPAGSVTAVSATAPAGSIISTTNPAGSITAVSATAPAGSVMTTNQVAGSILATSAVQPAGSLLTIITPAGSVQGVRTDNASVIAVLQNSSIFALPVGSFITVQQAPSIVGTYAEDAGSATADKGLFVLGVRNDTIASLTSADLDYGAYAQDSAGRQIIKPFVSEDATLISYVGSTVSGSVQLIQASAIGKRSYITDFIISNTGATTALVTFQGGDTSIIGQYIAPTAGGMVATGINIPLKNAIVSQDLAFKVSPSTSVLYLTVKGYQAP